MLSRIIFIKNIIIITFFLWVYSPASVYSNQTNDEKYPFGRVFTTHSQKLTLDKNRLNQKKLIQSNIAITDINLNQKKSINVKENQNNSITVQGLIVKPDGSYTLWVNNTNINHASINNTKIGFKARPNKKSSTVLISKDKKRRNVKPGQQWQLDTNQVIETYSTDNRYSNENKDASLRATTESNTLPNTELKPEDASP